MKKKEVIHLNEKVLVDIDAQIQEAQLVLPLNHPVRSELGFVRTKLYSALRMNRSNKHEPQDKWVILVESETPFLKDIQ